jgi:hypothetical protein
MHDISIKICENVALTGSHYGWLDVRIFYALAIGPFDNDIFAADTNMHVSKGELHCMR